MSNNAGSFVIGVCFILIIAVVGVSVYALISPGPTSSIEVEFVGDNIALMPAHSTLILANDPEKGFSTIICKIVHESPGQVTHPMLLWDTPVMLRETGQTEVIKDCPSVVISVTLINDDTVEVHWPDGWYGL